MKQLSYIIAKGFRILIFALVFGSIILQPVLESMTVVEPQAFSWLDLDAENDSSEKETKELEDTKDKKIEIRLMVGELRSNVFTKRVSFYGTKDLKIDVIIAVHDPPPETA
ncbi:hypothetical protein N9672_02355 [Flavobacteriaceae bacterium]|nr:hypothetical protein [Flavobacteriaceae bacterium]MDB4206364.1 hypothetical protein [Flavobacteriaceae bacterium]